MTDFTRLTIIGTSRKADLVVPDDETIGGLLPRLMELLGEQPGSVSRPLTLVRATGEQLDIAQTAAQQDVADGELLRLVRADDAPPPPEVADVTDVLGESLRDRAGLWNDASRELTGSLAVGLLGVTLAMVWPVSRPTAALAIALVLAVAVAFGRFHRRWPTLALTAGALGLLLTTATAYALAEGGSLGMATAVAVLVGGGWICLGFGFGVGLGSRPARIGALVGVCLAGLWWVLAVGLSAGLVRSAGVTAAVAVVACGLLPRAAMAASGLTGLDDQVVEGQRRRRSDVELTVNDAYRLLSWATFAAALPLALTVAVLLSARTWWAVAAGGLVALVTALRTRAFPLASQQIVLWLAVLVALLVGLLRQPAVSDGEATVALAALLVVVAVLVLARPVAHRRAAWRRIGNLIEAVCVIALIPVLLGLFGIYADLLGAF